MEGLGPVVSTGKEIPVMNGFSLWSEVVKSAFGKTQREQILGGLGGGQCLSKK